MLRHPLRAVLFSLFLCGSLALHAQTVFDFDDNCRKAYASIIVLRLDAGRAWIETEKKARPDNLIPYFLDNYLDFFNLFFNEDPAEYQKRKPNQDVRLRLLKQGDARSPLYLFCRAVINYQWAAVDVKFGNHWTAAWEFRRCFLMSKDNQDQFPGFLPSKMLAGAMQVAAGTIPPGYRWLSNLLGIRGSIPEGMQQLSDFIGSADPWAKLFRDEAIFYWLYLRFYIGNEKEEVLNWIAAEKLDLVNNHLFAFLAANLSLNAQRASATERIIRGRNHDPGYFQTPVWDQEMGYAKNGHLDPQSVEYLDRFVNEFKGKSYVRDALQKLSWMYYLQGDRKKAEAVRSQILKRGSTDTEADKQALKDAQSGKWPNPALLKARMLDDGGYFAEALAQLGDRTAASFADPGDRLEFEYRRGRLYDALGRKDEAITAYASAISLGRNRAEYYAARAALQTGYIYEARGDKTTAIGYFDQVMAMGDHDYKNALDQKAKAGIARCRVK